MASLIEGYEYDIFISYRQKDNKGERWVTEFVNSLKTELEATFKEDISIYFDENPHDGLLETHDVDDSLKDKLKCLIFIPIISQTYCDPNSFAWRNEFLAFRDFATTDQFGVKAKVAGGNVASRILPVRIHELDAADVKLFEKETGGVMRALDFVFKSSGVNRPLLAHEEHPQDNLNKTFYRDQVNKVANAVKEIFTSLKKPATQTSPITRPDEPATRTSSRNRKTLLTAITLLVVLTVAGYLIYPKFSLFGKKNEILNKSIAVLPFVNMSNDPEQEYFSNGLTEEIIDRLTKIPDLRVISRTSIMEYKKSEKRIPEIARELGVSYVLEGSVRKSENNLRITVQLIKAGNDEHIWSETLDRPLSEIFQMQRDIATQLASYFKITLTESDKGSLNHIPTRFISAYDYYLKANEMSAQRSLENNQAIEMLKKALIIDPQFIEAMGTLSFYYAKKGRDLKEGENWLDTAYYYASKAISISPESGHANRSLGFVLFYQDKDSLATPYFKKAYWSGSSLGLRPLSSICLRLGKADSSFYYAKMLAYWDPFSAAYSQLTIIFMVLGEWDSARHYVNMGLTSKGSSTTKDLMNIAAIYFYINTGEYDNGLKLINDNFARTKDPAIANEVSLYRKHIYALKKDWPKLSSMLTESDLEWKALVYKSTGNKNEFDKIVSELKRNNYAGDRLHLLQYDFRKAINELKAMPAEKRYVFYQRWLSDPFAQEFIKTAEFRNLFEGYESWTKKMLARIKTINESGPQ